MMCFSLTAGIRAGTFPRSQSKTAVPDVGCSIIFTKGRTPLVFFSTCVPLHHFMALDSPHWQATCFTHYPSLLHFLYNLHRLPPSTVVVAEKVSLEYFKAQIQGEKNNLWGCKYISRVKDKQFSEKKKYFFWAGVTNTKSIYSWKTTAASSQATLSTVVTKLNKLLFQSQYTKN